MTDETNEQHEEQNDEATEPQWLEPSGVGGEYMRHSQAMEPANRVPIYKAFAIGPGYNVGMLRKMAENYKPKRIVVIEHDGQGFEVRRLANNDDVSLFYTSLDPKKTEQLSKDVPSLAGEQLAHLKRVVSEFLKADEAELVKYDAKGPQARAVGCIGYAYIQRRVASIAAFRKNEEGATAAIRDGLLAMEAEGFLRKLSDAESQELIDSSAAVYRINKGAL